MDLPELLWQDSMVSGLDEDYLHQGMGIESSANMYDDMPTFSGPSEPVSPSSGSLDSAASTGNTAWQPWASSYPPLYAGNDGTFAGHTPYNTQPTINDHFDMFASPTPYYEREVSTSLAQAQIEEPIPQEVVDLAAHINSLPKLRGGDLGENEFPYRQTLKTDARLRGQISKKTGCLFLEHKGGKLRKWLFDERLFTREMWLYLTDPDYMRVQERARRGRKRKTSTDGDFKFVAMVAPQSSPTSSPRKRRRSSAAKSIEGQSVQSTGQNHASNAELLPACDVSRHSTSEHGIQSSSTQHDQATVSDDSAAVEPSAASTNDTTTERIVETLPFSMDTTDLTGMLSRDLEHA